MCFLFAEVIKENSMCLCEEPTNVVVCNDDGETRGQTKMEQMDHILLFHDLSIRDLNEWVKTLRAEIAELREMVPRRAHLTLVPK
jgi:hypothetical protein